MGNYLNPGNSGFVEIRNGEYVDKSGLIDLVNRVMCTPRKLSCVSRPRRFGKSFAAKMLAARRVLRFRRRYPARRYQL